MADDRRYDRFYTAIMIAVLVGAMGVTAVSVKYRRGHCAITGDAKQYYAWARSIVLDGDINFRNDFELLSPPDGFPAEYWKVTARGNTPNITPVGVAILEIPGLLAGHLVTRYLTHFKPDGVSPPYQLSVTWSLIVFYVASLFLLDRAMVVLGSSRYWAMVFGVFTVLGTGLIHYICSAGMAHAPAVAVLSLLMFIISRRRQSPEGWSLPAALGIGALLGLLFLIRNTNIILFPFIAVLAHHQQRVRTRELLPILGGALIVALIQPVVLFLLYGNWRLLFYSDKGFSSGIAGIFNVIFSPRRGLLIYTPGIAVLVVILACAVGRRKALAPLAVAALATLLVFVIANGTWFCWWFGGFGNRAFVEVMPVLTLTAALTMTGIQTRRTPRILVTALLACAVAANLYLWVGYLLEAYPRGGDVGLARTWLWPGYKPSPTQTIAAGGSLQDVGDGEFEHYVLKSDKPVLQIFWEQTDEQCRAQMPIAENIARRYESVLRVVRTPAENRPIIMQTYQVTALPALLVFRSGNVVFRHTGLMDEAQLSAELDRLLEDPN